MRHSVNDGQQLLNPQEQAKRLSKHRNALATALESAPAAELKRLIREVEAASEFYVARRMNHSVRQALTGKQIDEVDV